LAAVAKGRRRHYARWQRSAAGERAGNLVGHDGHIQLETHAPHHDHARKLSGQRRSRGRLIECSRPDAGDGRPCLHANADAYLHTNAGTDTRAYSCTYSCTYECTYECTDCRTDDDPDYVREHSERAKLAGDRTR
jgi:hypothetical protein